MLSRLSGRTEGDDPDCGQLVGQLSGGGTVIISLGRWHPAGDMCCVEVYGTAATDRGSIFSNRTMESKYWSRLSAPRSRISLQP